MYLRFLPIVAVANIISKTTAAHLRAADVSTDLDSNPHRSLQNIVEWQWHNCAQYKTASQSSTYSSTAPASRAVDGNTDGNYHDGEVTHTNFQSRPWWEVNLENGYWIRKVKIYNRSDCCSDRLQNFDIIIRETVNEREEPERHRVTVDEEADGVYEIEFDEPIRGEYVRIQLNQPGQQALSLAEVEVEGILAWKWSIWFSEEERDIGFGDCRRYRYNNSFGPFSEAAIISGWRCRGGECDENSIRCEVPYAFYQYQDQGQIVIDNDTFAETYGDVDRSQDSTVYSIRSTYRTSGCSTTELQNPFSCGSGQLAYGFDCRDSRYCGQLDMSCNGGDFFVGTETVVALNGLNQRSDQTLDIMVQRSVDSCEWDDVDLSEEGLYEHQTRDFGGFTGTLDIVSSERVYTDEREFGEWIAPYGRALNGLGCGGRKFRFDLGRLIDTCDNKSFRTCRVSHCVSLVGAPSNIVSFDPNGVATHLGLAHCLNTIASCGFDVPDRPLECT